MPRISHALLAILLALAGTAAAGCGGARAEADLDAAFARIQVEEARIENASGADPRDCAALEGCPEIRDATQRLCAIADDIDDADALARCERARRRASGCDELASACGEGSPP